MQIYHIGYVSQLSNIVPIVLLDSFCAKIPNNVFLMPCIISTYAARICFQCYNLTP